MFKRWFQTSAADAEFENEGHRNGGAGPGPAVAEWPRGEAAGREPTVAGGPELASASVAAKFAPFEEIYRNAPVKPPKVAYGILKVAEMANSPHLAGLSAETKRASLLMALDAAGVQLEDLLQDAMARQRALNDYEELQHRRLKEFEAAKAKENDAIQEEIDRVTAGHLARIQGNREEVARREEGFRAWKKRKQQESEVIAEAAAFCAPPGSANNPGSLAAALARYGAEAVVGKGV